MFEDLEVSRGWARWNDANGVYTTSRNLPANSQRPQDLLRKISKLSKSPFSKNCVFKIFGFLGPGALGPPRGWTWGCTPIVLCDIYQTHQRSSLYDKPLLRYWNSKFKIRSHLASKRKVEKASQYGHLSRFIMGYRTYKFQGCRLIDKKVRKWLRPKWENFQSQFSKNSLIRFGWNLAGR